MIRYKIFRSHDHCKIYSICVYIYKVYIYMSVTSTVNKLLESLISIGLLLCFRNKSEMSPVSWLLVDFRVFFAGRNHPRLQTWQLTNRTLPGIDMLPNKEFWPRGTNLHGDLPLLFHQGPGFCSPLAMKLLMMGCAQFAKSPNCAWSRKLRELRRAEKKMQCIVTNYMEVS